MRGLVTGGAGFIGSTLVDRLLAEGHVVDVVDDLSTGSLANLAEARVANGTFRFHQIDVRAPELVELLARRRPEVVFHLAAQASMAVSVEAPIDDAEVNVIGSLRVLEAARRAGVRKVVYAGSGGALYDGAEPDDLPLDEQHPQRPRSPYGVSKKVVLDYLSTYREQYGLEFSALALANVYGPRQDPEGEAGVVAIFGATLAAEKRCVIHGDGEQTRDFVYVDDAVDAFARAADRGSGLLMNIGTGTETSINELYKLMARAAGTRLAPKRGPVRDGDVRRSALDSSRASLHLGWRPFTSLNDGIAAVVEAFAQAKSTPRTTR